MDNCIFCKIAAGEIPSYILHEDDDFKVIFDVNPATKGHVLIVPKEHYANIFELPEDKAAKVYVLAKKLAKVISDITECEGINILQNNGEAAGQTVFHFHMHIIPRYSKDTANINWDPIDIEENEVLNIIDKAKKIFQD